MTETPEQTKARRVEAFINGLRLSDGKSELAVDVVVASDEAAGMTLVPRSQVEWQPIETAPTDGTEVLLWVAPGEGLSGFRCVGAYHEDAGWTVCELRDATHWMPLPITAPTAVSKCAHCDDTETVTSCDGAEILCPHCTF